MESNKILIGAQFYNEKSKDKADSFLLEFIVNKDATLQQLMDGIKYGLKKRVKENEIYKKCSAIYEACVANYDYRNDIYVNVTLSSYNPNIKMNMDENRRIIIKATDMQKKLCDFGFLSSTRIIFDTTGAYSSFEVQVNVIEPFNVKTTPKTEKVFPEYNISTRQLYKFNDEPIEIIAPSNPPQKPKNNIINSILPTIIMVISMGLIRVIMPSNGMSGIYMIAMYVMMAVSTVISTLFITRQQKKEYEKDLAEWKQQYTDYIDETMYGIKKRQEQNARKLDVLYPEVDTLFKSMATVNGSMYSRSCQDADFLSIRLGRSDYVENFFEIQGSKKDVVFSNETFEFVEKNGDTGIKIYLKDSEDYHPSTQKNYLSSLPAAISEKFKYMNNAPLIYSLKNVGSLGVVSKNQSDVNNFLHKMIFEICYYHSPEEVQFVMLFDRTYNWFKMEEDILLYKFLPHFRGLFSDRSQFVFSSESANLVFGSLMDILSKRSSGKSAKKPHIIVVIHDEYDIKEHALASFLPERPKDGEEYKNNLGITFVFAKRYKEHLPMYCNDVISFKGKESSIVPYNDINLEKTFTRVEWEKEETGRAYNTYKSLAVILYSKISENGKVPSIVSLFELYNIQCTWNEQKGIEHNINIADNWGYKRDEKGNIKFNENGMPERLYDVAKSLKVPIGFTENGGTTLDLHERGDGPHMLVAGTTGSGKSETIISYILSLCMRFRPEELNLMLVDMKGGGFVKRVGDLPHIVGKVTDVDGDENGTGDEYMLRRFLDSLTAEIKRRKLKLNEMHVDNADSYIKACRDIEGHIKKLSRASQRGTDRDYEIPDADVLRNLAENEKLSHLILIVDEFTELKRFSSESNDIDFMKEISTIARVGRSLGIHIILVSQNIEGAINDEIRVNSKSKLCLKVATPQASKEMIGTDLAASPTMPGNGRAYLLVGTGTRFTYFQSAYSGSNAISSMEMPFKMIQAEKNGMYTEFYNSENDNEEMKKKKKELSNSGGTLTQCTVMMNAIIEEFEKGDYFKPHIVFQTPLPSKVVLKNGKPFILKN